MQAGQAAGLLALLAHSAVDFDLSYLSILLWLAALAGAAVAGSLRGSGGDPLRSPGRLAASIGLGLVALASLLVSVPMGQAEAYQRQSEQAAGAGAVGAALAEYARAARLSPLHPAPTMPGPCW